jgi:hypothetical protein
MTETEFRADTIPGTQAAHCFISIYAMHLNMSAVRRSSSEKLQAVR